MAFTSRPEIAAWSTEVPRGLVHHCHEGGRTGATSSTPRSSPDKPEPGSIVVDAAVGIEPGHVVTLPIRSITSDRPVSAPRPSRELPIDQVLGLPGALRPGGLPDGSFVGIGGRRFGYGHPRSRSVRLKKAAFQAAIPDELSRLAGRSPEELATSGG